MTRASRIVAVSNRVGPVRNAAVAGGLAVALVEALRESQGLWFGWSGDTYDDAQVPAKGRLHTERAGGLTLATVDLPREDYERYYNGYANRCLWPLMHFRMDLMRYERSDFESYRRINREFARSLLPLLKSDDLVWVHDYHLFPLASDLRALGVQQRIGFFLHTPFPPADIFASLPGHEELLRALFDYDVIGFQTDQDLQRFHSCVERLAHGRVVKNSVQAYGRKLTARAFPIGIDPVQFRKLASTAEGEAQCARMRATLDGRALIIGVDRLDYSKGLLRRIEAYERLLELHPDTHRQIEMLQIAPISRGELKAYHDFRVELDQAAARINGRFAQVDWTPVRYLNQALQRKSLAGLYRASRIGLVTPMRDGMNLVAKEYVAAQDPDDPGVLVLSKFAGAAQQMKQALQVNPYDVEEMAETLQAARLMPLTERRQRHAELLRGLSSEDVRHWRDSFVRELGNAHTLRRASADENHGTAPQVRTSKIKTEDLSVSNGDKDVTGIKSARMGAA